MNNEKVGIVGCGVSGLTVGIRLLESGIPVEILAREGTPRTTSDVAGAFWYPYRSEPRTRVLGWAAISHRFYSELAERGEGGVVETMVTHLYADQIKEPWWAGCTKDLRFYEAEELCGAYCSRTGTAHPFIGAHSYTSLLIETPIYMPYLRERFTALGGIAHEETVPSLQSLEGRFGVVVNCSGVWSRELVGDTESFPIRGQIVRVRRDPRTPLAVYDGNDCYIVVRSNDCIIGGFNAENDWSVEPDPEGRRALLQRAAVLASYVDLPGFEHPEVIGDAVGLRPGRSTVRLESEQLTPRLKVIHNYGHGGSGFSLAWGCAEEVLSLLKAPH